MLIEFRYIGSLSLTYYSALELHKRSNDDNNVILSDFLIRW